MVKPVETSIFPGGSVNSSLPSPSLHRPRLAMVPGRPRGHCRWRRRTMGGHRSRPGAELIGPVLKGSDCNHGKSPFLLGKLTINGHFQ